MIRVCFVGIWLRAGRSHPKNPWQSLDFGDGAAARHLHRTPRRHRAASRMSKPGPFHSATSCSALRAAAVATRWHSSFRRRSSACCRAKFRAGARETGFPVEGALAIVFDAFGRTGGAGASWASIASCARRAPRPGLAFGQLHHGRRSLENGAERVDPGFHRAAARARGSLRGSRRLGGMLVGLAQKEGYDHLQRHRIYAELRGLLREVHVGAPSEKSNAPAA